MTTDFVDSPIGDIPEIAIDSGGLFTPGAAFTIKLAADLVNKCVALAESKDADFTAKMGELTNAVTGWLATNPAADAVAGAITITAPVEPSMTVSDTSTALVFNNANTQTTAIVTDLVTKFGTFMSTWFPDEADTYTAAEAYLLAAITNATSGIVPAAIKTAILEDARQQVLAEQNRATADLYESQAAQRHRLPPGAQAGQAKRLAQNALDRIAEASRAIAVKDFELSNQTALEAVRLAIASRVSAIDTAKDYIASLVSGGYQLGTQLVGTAHGAEVAKLSAAYQAYSSRTGAAELALRAAQADETLAFEASKVNQARDMSEREDYLKSFLAQAQIIGHQVVAMLNNLRAGSSATYEVRV